MFLSGDVCRAVLEMASLCVDLEYPEYRLVLAHPNLPGFIGKALLSDDTALINAALRLVYDVRNPKPTYSTIRVQYTFQRVEIIIYCMYYIEQDCNNLFSFI